MNDEERRSIVLDALTAVAPDIGRDEVEPRTRFRDQFDFDSMDFLNFVIGLHERTGIDLPEADYPALMTLEGAVDYLRAREA